MAFQVRAVPAEGLASALAEGTDGAGSCVVDRWNATELPAREPVVRDRWRDDKWNANKDRPGWAAGMWETWPVNLPVARGYTNIA